MATFTLLLVFIIPRTSTSAPAAPSPSTGGVSLLLTEKQHHSYRNFADLAERENEGVDYRIDIDDRSETADTLVIAIHGGKIEPGTSETARALASEKYSRYVFEGLKDEGSWGLHLTSTRFDEPKLLTLLKKHDYVISLHGFRDRVEGQQSVLIGGLDEKFMQVARAEFEAAGFDSINPGDWDYLDELNGGGDTNVCNMSLITGLQLEISRSLRKRLVTEDELMAKFTGAVDAALDHMRAEQAD